MPAGHLAALNRRLGRARAAMAQHRIQPVDTGPTASTDSAKIAVIVPVFNAMPYLRELLDSLHAQDLPDRHYEVILVDDGSTDDGPALMSARQRTQTNLRLIRQRNSGWPGQPRNRGLDAARAQYVFFADADDVLAPQALSAMLAFAEDHRSDVVIPRLTGLNGRKVHRTVFERSFIDAPLPRAFITLSPQKLIRRELIETAHLRFAEGRVRLEDGIFISACYLAAARVSILAEDDYYFLRARDDSGNISARRSNPRGYTASVRRIAGQIDAAGLPDPVRRRLLLELYERKILRSYQPERYLSMGRWRRAAWIRAHQQFLRDFVPEAMERDLPYPAAMRSAALRLADPDAQLAAVRRERLLGGPWRQVGSEALALHAEHEVDRAVLVARARGAEQRLEYELRRGPEGWSAAVDAPSLAVYDLYVCAVHDGWRGPERRVRARLDPLDTPAGRLYATKNGYLSLDARARRRDPR